MGFVVGAFTLVVAHITAVVCTVFAAVDTLAFAVRIETLLVGSRVLRGVGEVAHVASLRHSLQPQKYT